LSGFTVPTTEPTSLYAGDRWQWTAEYSDYPNATFTLTYHLDGGSSVSGIQATATPSTDTNYTVDVAASTTATYSAGTYKWIARVANSTDIHTINSGVLLVLPNRATTTAAQTHSEIMLAAIEARLEGRVASGGDIEQYAIANRTVAKIPFEQLIAKRGYYRQSVWRERNPNAQNPMTLVNFWAR
jgi:hypothetical protein